MLSTTKIDPEIAGRLSNRVQNLMLNLRPVSDEFLPDGLVRNLRAANMHKDRQRRLVRNHLVTTPVDPVDHLPRNVARFIKQERNLVGKTEKQNLPRVLDLFSTRNPYFYDEWKARVR